MVEVFKTNVHNADEAQRLVTYIRERFSDYRANFDLADCDKILRVKCAHGSVCAESLIGLMRSQGFDAEVLPDELPLHTAWFSHARIPEKK